MAENTNVPSKAGKEELKTMRRVRFLVVNPTDFLLLLTKGLVLSKRIELLEGVPADAMLVNMTVDHVRGSIVFVVQSSEYDEVELKDMPPVQEVAISQGVKDATKKARSKRK